MKNFKISYAIDEENNYFSAYILRAEDETTAAAFHREKHPGVDSYISAISDIELESMQARGMNVETVPADYIPAENDDEGEEPARTAEEIVAEIIEYFKNNEDVFNDCIEELDSYNGYLGDDRYYNMDDLDEFYNGAEPSEVLRRAFYGYDEETWTTDASGDKTYGAFNPNRDYYKYNGYGNLVSADFKDYSAQLDKYAIEEMSENRRYIDSIDNDDSLAALFDELERAEEIAAA